METSFLTEKLNLPEKTGVTYLKLQLTENVLVILPMSYAQSVLASPARRITPVPNMPDCIVGLVHQRSRVFWLVDLSQMFQLQSIERNLQEYYIAVIKVDNISLALLVSEIKGTVRLLENTINPLTNKTNIPSGLIPYLKGYSNLEKENYWILDTEKIVKSPVLMSNL